MSTNPADAAPCRHAGAPLQAVVDRTARVVQELASHPGLLAEYGITAEEFDRALPQAIEAIRGKMSASNSTRREFLAKLLEHLLELGLATSLAVPEYGKDTVYRLEVPSIGSVAIIQKGCPDGAHSSTRWSIPDWATETYLWWLCPSMASHPGEHIVKGVNRIRKRFIDESGGVLSGIIFHNELCGTSLRPCPKISRNATIEGKTVPAPCIYSMPSRSGDGASWNWGGREKPKFPAILLSAFSIAENEAENFTGYVGFERRLNGALRTKVITRYGAGRSTTYRS